MASFLEKITEYWNVFVAWGSSLDWALILPVLIIALSLIAILVIIILLSVDRYSDKKFLKDVKRSSSTVRVIRLDMANSKVHYFNTFLMSRARDITFDQWISMLPVSEQPNVRRWINDILEGKNETNYIETSVTFFSDKRTVVPGFYKIYKLVPSKRVIYLENRLLRASNEKFVDKDLSNVTDFGKALELNGTDQGMTFCFTLAPKASNNDGVDLEKFRNELSSDVILRFKRCLGTFVKGNMKQIQISANEFLVANFDMADKTQAIAFALRVINKLNHDMNELRRKNANEPYYEVRCGVVENKDIGDDYNEIMAGARYTSNAQFTTSSNLGFFDKDDLSLDLFNNSEESKSEIANIVRGKKFVDRFRPVFSVKGKSVMGYCVRTLPLNTAFDSVEEMKLYAYRAKDSATLFSAIVKDASGRFVAERGANDKLKLFLPAMVCEMSAITKSMPKMKKAKEADIVFVFRESDIFANINKDSGQTFLNALIDLKNKDYKVALLLEDKTLLLNDSIYSRCDQFFIDFSESAGESSGTRVRSQISALVDKLVKFDKPIIATNLSSWMSIEMVVGAGIEYISSDVFAPYDDNLKPINKKSLDKLYGISERK